MGDEVVLRFKFFDEDDSTLRQAVASLDITAKEYPFLLGGSSAYIKSLLTEDMEESQMDQEPIDPSWMEGISRIQLGEDSQEEKNMMEKIKEVRSREVEAKGKDVKSPKVLKFQAAEGFYPGDMYKCICFMRLFRWVFDERYYGLRVTSPDFPSTIQAYSQHLSSTPLFKLCPAIDPPSPIDPASPPYTLASQLEELQSFKGIATFSLANRMLGGFSAIDRLCQLAMGGLVYFGTELEFNQVMKKVELENLEDDEFENDKMDKDGFGGLLELADEWDKRGLGEINKEFGGL